MTSSSPRKSASSFFFIVTFLLCIFALASFLVYSLSSSSSPTTKTSSSKLNIANNEEIRKNDGNKIKEVVTSDQDHHHHDHECTDDDTLRGFFGCQCGLETLQGETLNGPCLFGQPRSYKLNSTVTITTCHEMQLRIAVVIQSSLSTSSPSSFLKPLLFLRKHSLFEQCRKDKGGARLIIPHQFFSPNGFSVTTSSMMKAGLDKNGNQQLRNFVNNKLYPHVVVIDLLSSISSSDSFDFYHDMIREMIEGGSARRIILVANKKNRNKQQQHNISSVVAYRLATDETLNALLAKGSSLSAGKIILVNVDDDHDNDIQKQEEERAAFIAGKIHKTICTKCTPPTPVPPQLEENLKKRVLVQGVSSSSSLSTTKTKTKTICPPGSTVDSVWGFDKIKQFHSNEYYLSSASSSSSSSSQKTKSFGKWISTNDVDDDESVALVTNEMRRQRRAEILEKVCRRVGQGQEENSQDKNNSSPSSSCEWFNKPRGWNPFQGPDSFSVNNAVTIFRAKNSEQKEQEFQFYDGEKNNNTNQEQQQQNWCYDYQDPIKCLRNKIILFIGDSHVLNMAQMTCRMLLRNPKDLNETRQHHGFCGKLDARFARPITTVYFPEIDTTLAMFRLRYNISNQMHRFYNHPWHKVLLQSDFIFITRGMWDIVYRDTPKREVFEEYRDTLKYLARTFVRARIIVKLLHYDHKKIWGCSTDKRQRDIRDAQICAVSQASKDFWRSFTNKRILGSEIITRSNKFSIYDSFGMTRELPYQDAADVLGHHYQGSIQESLVQMMFSIMCPPQPQNFTHILKLREQAARISCRRLVSVKETEQRKLKCACTNSSAYAGVPRAAQFCTSIRRTNLVPFAHDV